MSRIVASRAAAPLVAALIAVSALAVPALAAEVELQPDTKGCTGVLPSTEGNTDMQLVGGSLSPGGTAIFEITYPLDASDLGKEFTITACAFINGEAALKYLVSFVPSNETFTLRMTFAIPEDAPVGGTYCNYAKTTRSPTAAQASQRKAGPACFIIRPPRTTTTTPTSPPSTPAPGGSSAPPTGGGSSTPGSPDDDSSVSTPILLPDTAMGLRPADHVPCVLLADGRHAPGFAMR